VRRHRQSTEEILSALTPVETSWRDPHSEAVIGVIRAIPDREASDAIDVQAMLATDFEAGLTAVRLLLDMSKDEFEPALRARLGAGGIGIRRFISQPGEFVQALVDLGAAEAIREMRSRPMTWRDILVERLKGGRGSAIKGQARGRSLEDFAEIIVRRVFGGAFDARCRFVGAKGTSTEKADFAIPSKDDPGILIEAKAYGATGSKQTDVLGDIARIVEQKRHDTDLLLLTDGTTWRARQNDLRKLVTMQNEGLITRIYTRSMGEELERDLQDLKNEHSL
jgi:hypothetical protein